MRMAALVLVCVGLLALPREFAPLATAQPMPVSMGFRNDTKVPVVVVGWTLVKNMPLRGQPIVVPPGKTVSENNLPAGTVRFFSIFDAAQPARITYLRDERIQLGNADALFSIRYHPNGPQRMILMKE